MESAGYENDTHVAALKDCNYSQNDKIYPSELELDEKSVNSAAFSANTNHDIYNNKEYLRLQHELDRVKQLLDDERVETSQLHQCLQASSIELGRLKRELNRDYDEAAGESVSTA